MNTAKVRFAAMHTDFVIYQFARNIIRSGLCNIILHAEIEYKRNNDLFYSLNVYRKRVHFVLPLQYSLSFIDISTLNVR
jgi:hypothetical protein